MQLSGWILGKVLKKLLLIRVLEMLQLVIVIKQDNFKMLPSKTFVSAQEKNPSGCKKFWTV